MRLLFNIVLFLVYSVTGFAQQRDFSEWDATAFCSYTKHHPFTYVKADNNWEILQTLRTPHTRAYLDSLGIHNTDSQMMLLRIEGLISQDENKNWISLMPILDSLQTVKARTYSLQVAQTLYPQIKNDIFSLINVLKQEGLQESIYTILFSYILDGEIWKSLNSYEDLKSAATWDGECWALYYPRKFSSGTNGYDNFNLCWSKHQPEFVWKELSLKTFIEPFLADYKENGKIISSDIYAKALALGMINKNGYLCIPIINSQNKDSQLNQISDEIIKVITQYFASSRIVSDFQEEFRINQDNKKLACTMLYHEVMWDLMDLLINDNIVNIPILWKDKNLKSMYSVVFIKN